MSMSGERVMRVEEVEACWDREDTWLVPAIPGLTSERHGVHWFLCAEGDRLAGPFPTLAASLRLLSSVEE